MLGRKPCWLVENLSIFETHFCIKWCFKDSFKSPDFKKTMNLCNLESAAAAAKVECLGENLSVWWKI
jgi:hypothetical protein